MTSIYSTLHDIPTVPTQENAEYATQFSPFEWDPVASMVQSNSQNEDSFEEQRLAVRTNAYSIDKYAGVVQGSGTLTHTKNVITHGAPGTGKTFVGQYTVLYAISRGLRCMSTTLMGARANAIGGIHLHKFLFLPTQGNCSHPYRCAQQAIDKITRNKLFHHVLLTVDVIFLDEAGQVSAEQLAIIDIILRKLRNSRMPFGGVLILGTMDHTQIQPINALPFLLSSLILTSLTMVELKESVRAADDPLFREFQNLTRENPYILLSSPEKKARFEWLVANIFTFVQDFNDPRITAQMARMFARKSKVKSSTALYTESLLSSLEASNDTQFHIRNSVDHQVRSGTAGDYTSASASTVKSLNNHLKEPQKLIFYEWGLYECTTNKSGQYNQSNLALLVDLPSQEVLDTFSPFPIWIAPPGTQYIDFLDNEADRPTKAQLESWNWKQVSIGIAPERNVVARGGFQARRKQYPLKHVGALTINKSQGETIPAGIAVEISSTDTCPWEKGQIVVCFSRTKTSAAMIIVGDVRFVTQKLWELITTANQWTQMMENILDMVTINSDGNHAAPHTLHYAQYFPFQLCDATLPTDSTGYVYLLVSYSNPNFTYIGQTQNLSQRFRQHQSGHGAVGTERAEDRPFYVAAYITGLIHYNTTKRMALESQWQHYRDQSIGRGDDDVFSIIDQGERVVRDQNANAVVNGSPDRINFVRMVTRRQL